MSDNIMIEAKNMSLSYKFTTRTGMMRSLKRLIYREQKKQYHQALKDISFTIKAGENIAIIGSNGSGKSTLLRIIAGTLSPDKGSIKVNSSDVSLLAIGSGFRPLLSGRENIYLNGLLLGFSHKEINRRIQEIIAFAEIGDFIDQPVQSYSSGMRSRLSFSIVACLDPEVLLIDELFSVGDVAFRQKSSERITEMINADRTVIMVSHSMDVVRSQCNKVIWLEKGELMGIGNPNEMVDRYLASLKKK